MRLMIVEDDRKAARLLARGLEEEGFTVDVAHSVAQADESVYTVEYDLLVLDWMLPRTSGLEFCQTLRSRGLQTPVLMLTARDSVGDRVLGLNTGADDYLTKPFEFEELLARARALLRRSELTRLPVLQIADLTLDPGTHQVSRANVVLDLTPKELAILEILMRRNGEVVSRSRLAEQIWKADQIGFDNLIDAHISNLRRKLDKKGLQPLIQTLRGRGFRLAPEAVDVA